MLIHYSIVSPLSRIILKIAWQDDRKPPCWRIRPGGRPTRRQARPPRNEKRGPGRHAAKAPPRPVARYKIKVPDPWTGAATVSSPPPPATAPPAANRHAGPVTRGDTAPARPIGRLSIQGHDPMDRSCHMVKRHRTLKIGSKRRLMIPDATRTSRMNIPYCSSQR